MRFQPCWSVIALVGSVATASAQQAPAKQAPAKQAPAKQAPAKQAPMGGGMQMSAAGSWNATSMTGPKDSVVTTYLLTIAADGKSATMTFPKRDPIPARIIAMAGDSVVIDAGPYPSVLRAGVTVNSLHSVNHFKGTTMTGTFEAHYAGGDVLKGKMKATRAK